MEITIETHEAFMAAKCGLMSMLSDKYVYDTIKNDILFFYPSTGILTLHSIIGRDESLNMPIVDTKHKKREWFVSSNKELIEVLKTI